LKVRLNSKYNMDYHFYFYFLITCGQKKISKKVAINYFLNER